MAVFGTYDEIADFMLNDWWGASGPRKWDIGPGGVITVNIAGLNSAGQNLALAALQLWEDVADVDFQIVTGPANITIDDNQPGAFFSGPATNGFFTSATINIEPNFQGEPTILNSNVFFAYVHELGHLLSLGHPGHYDGSNVAYSTHAFFSNDSYQLSTMSYFSQAANPTINGTRALPLMPMIADIIGVQLIYGAAPNTRSGDTIYGIGANAGSPLFDPQSFPGTAIAVTIYDTGGVDTLNYPGYLANQVFNLNAEGISSVAGLQGNLIIARGVDIENAVGGEGRDVMNGNALNNLLVGSGGDDTLLGDDGNDILDGGAGADSINGGAGFDIASYASAGSAVRVALWNPSLNTGDAAGDVIQFTTEAIFGTRYADNIQGNSSANNLRGGDGNDLILGGFGNDTLVGGAGADDMGGGAGFDVVSYAGGGAVRVAMWNPAANTGDAAGDNIRPDVEVVEGSFFNDTLEGNASANNLRGSFGHDRLSGGGGNDTLSGDFGNDTLDGGAGNDSLIGGGAADTFIYASGGGADVIADFLSGSSVIDVISLVGLGAAFDSFAEVINAATQNGADTVINFGAGQTLTLQNIIIADLDSDDFIFG